MRNTRKLSTISTVVAVAATLAVTCAWPTASHALTFDANAAFLDNEKPNGSEVNPFTDTSAGTWSYGYSTVPGSITLLTTHTDSFNLNAGIEGWFVPNNIIVPAVLQNTTALPIATNFGATLAAGQLLLHPGNPGPDGFASPSSDAILRFTAPYAGAYIISGDFQGSIAAGGNGTLDQILLNGVTIYSSAVEDNSFNFTQVLAVGDKVDFTVNAIANDVGSDSTGLRAILQTIPEPSTLALIGLGCLGIWLRRRKA